MKQTLVLITILLAFAKSTYALDLNAIYGNGMTSEITDFDIRLVLFEKVNCPKDMACIALAPITHVIELPIVRSYSDWCDSTTFVAEIDGRPYDGLLEILEVTDFSKISCRIKVPFMVETEYRTLNPWTNEWTQSNFGGKEFYIYK
jgi:hypothetical protein